MLYIRCCAAIASGFMFLWIAGANAWIPIRYYVYGRHTSSTPLVGGAFGAACVLLLPIPSLHRWWWAPFVIDLGSPFAIAAVIIGFRKVKGMLRPRK
jgi:hypothetical protein